MLKVAILAEKYAVDYTWYVDIMLNLIRIAGDYVSEEVWYRVIQIVVNRTDVQGYAAKTVFEALQAPACHENMVKVGGYILGEFGNLIAGDTRSSPAIQFELLHSKYHLCSSQTRCLLLSTYVKFVNLFSEIRPQIQEVLRQDANIKSADAEIQQRAVEYLQLSQIGDADILATVLEEMPAFPERESSILSSILQKKKPPMEGGNFKEEKPEKNLNNADKQTIQNGHEAKQTISQANIMIQPHQPPSQPSIPNSQSIDLLGLNFTPPVNNSNKQTPTSPVKSNQETLLDIFMGPEPTPPVITNNNLDSLFSNTFETEVIGNGLKAGSPTSNLPTFTPILNISDNHMQFLFTNMDVLFENQSLKILFKSEFKQNLARVTLTFINKTNFVFQNFGVQTSTTPTEIELLKMILKPSDTSNIAPNGQLVQIINAECVNEFSSVPQVEVQFR